MHEFSVASAVVDTAIRHAAGRPVSVVELRVGALRQVVPDSLDFAFGIVGRDTVCDGARLEQVPVAALLRCDHCAHEWDPAPAPVDDDDGCCGGCGAPTLPTFRCPACAQAGSQTLTGNELEVESITVQDPEPAPAPS